MAKEARRSFAIYHIREKGTDEYFTSDIFKSPVEVAHRYREYERGEFSSAYETFAAAFADANPITQEKFNDACENINSDQRVTALLDFDLDEGKVSVCESSDNKRLTYSLHDFSVAAFKAYRGSYRRNAWRRDIFTNSLAGKEIE